MHLLASETFQLSCQVWEQPFSFMEELYFPAALQRRPDQNTYPKMERKVCGTFPFWPDAFHTYMVVDSYQYRPDCLPILYQWLFWKFWDIFLASGLLQHKCLLGLYSEEICNAAPDFALSLSDFALTEVSHMIIFTIIVTQNWKDRS